MHRLLAHLVTAFALVMTVWGSGCVWASPAHDAMQRAGPSGQLMLGRVSEKLEYLVVPSAPSLSNLDAAVAAGGWRDHDKSTLNLGYQPNGAWVRFTVVNPSLQPLQRVLMIDRGFERIEAWVFSKATHQWSAPELSGTSIAPSRRALVSPAQGLPLRLPPGEAQIYLRLETTQAMLLTMRFIDPSEFDQQERGESLRMGAFFGAMLVMMIYNASLCMFTRDRSYLYYCGYLATAAFYIASAFGYGGFFVWAEWPWLASRAEGLSICLVVLAVTVFERQFLNLRHKGGILLHLNSVGIAYWTLASLMSALDPQAVSYLSIEKAGALSCVVSMATAIILWRRGNISAGYFVIAWSGLLSSTLYLTLAVAGVLPMNSYVRSAQLVGFVLEFLLLSIALAERINRERALRIQAQEALLSTQKKANQLLEERVVSRTQALEQANHELIKLSTTDLLTGLNNRRGFEDCFHMAIEQGRTQGVHLAFLMIDVDHFKRINDKHGHSFGDECLAVLGQTLANFSRRDREFSFAARLGGEEFAAVLYGATATNALAVAEQIRIAVAGLALSDSKQAVRFTVSIGVATWVPTSDDSQITFAKAADGALYLAKAQGRNQVCLASPD